MVEVILHHADQVLRAFEIEPKPLDRVLANYFRKNKEIGSMLRRSTSDAAFGVVRWKRRIDAVLAFSRVGSVSYKERAACYLAWKGCSDLCFSEFAVVARKYGIKFELMNLSRDELKVGEAVYHSFPDFIYNKFVDAYGKKGAAEIASGLNEQSSFTLRVNTLVSSVSDAIKELERSGVEFEKCDVSPVGVRLYKRFSLDKSDFFKKGIFEVQDEASQIASYLAVSGKDGTVLDTCAGAGGKSLAIAAVMNNKGRIIASDISADRLAEVRERAKRAGAKNIDVVVQSELERNELKYGKFDVVFIDAPCSGTGTLKRSPDLKWRLSEKHLVDYVKVQSELLKKFSALVKPGGRLVYVTCSVLEDENEAVVNRFISTTKFGVISCADLLKIHGIFVEDFVSGKGFLRLNPSKGPWDGFFAACLQKE